MSWFLKTVGTHEAVKTKVSLDSNIPQSIKTAISEVIDGAKLCNGVSVEGFGHTGGGFSNIGKLEILSVKIELDIPCLCEQAVSVPVSSETYTPVPPS